MPPKPPKTAVALVNIAQARQLLALYQANINRAEAERARLARELPAVIELDDLPKWIHLSRATIYRLRQRNRFPIRPRTRRSRSI